MTKTALYKTKTDFLVSDRSCIKTDGLRPHPPSVWPHLFRGAGHEKRRGEQLKWSLAFRLYIGSFPCAQLPGPVHSSYSPVGPSVFMYLFSIGLCFVCTFNCAF